MKHLLPILFIAAVAAGCKTSPPDLLENPEYRSLREEWKEPIEYAVLFGIEDPGGPAVGERGDEGAYRVRPDCSLIENGLRCVLSDADWFDKADILTVGTGGAPSGGSEARDGGTMSAKSFLLEEARKRRSDYLVLLRPGRFEVTYEGASSSFLWSAVVWSLFVPPTWWIPDEQYSAAFAVEAQVFDMKTKPRPSPRIFTFEKKITRNLTDFARGWHIFDLFPIPGPASGGHYADVGSYLLDWYMQDLSVESLETFLVYFAEEKQREAARETTPTPKPEVAPPPSKPVRESPAGFALIAGVNTYRDAGARGCSHCSEDAKAIRRVFVAAPPYVSSPEHVHLRTGAEADLSGLDRAVQKMLEAGPTAKDCVLVYLSGCGASRKGEKGEADVCFVPAGATEATSPSGLVSVTGLCRKLAESKAGKIVVVLDFAFGPSGLRSMGAKDQDTARAAFERLRDIASKRKGFALLMADDGAGEALELDAAKHGLFTGRLLDALEKGVTRLDEIRKQVAKDIESEADLMARKQTPVIFGQDSSTVK